MARLVSNSVRFFPTVADNLAVLLNRRNFSAPSSSTVANAVGGSSRQMIQRVEEKMKGVSGEKSSWMPDPITGNFTPEDKFGQVDVAQLRLILLNQSSGC